MVYDMLMVGIYAVLGVILMLIGHFLVDLAIPCNFPEEIKKGNEAVGYIMAGASIAIGVILKSAIMSPSVEVVEHNLVQGIGETLVYALIGIVLCIIGYLVMLVFNRKYNLNDEIGKGNKAAGIMIMGLFIGLGIIVSGAIY